MSAAWGGQPPNLVSGTHWGAAGIGILGSVMSASWETGEHGASPLANDGLVPGKEYLWYVASADAGVSIAAAENGQAVVTVPGDGYWAWSYRLVEDGVASAPVSVGISVGTLALGTVPCLQPSTSLTSGPVTITGLGGVNILPSACALPSTSVTTGPVQIYVPEINVTGAACQQASFSSALGPVVVVDRPVGPLPSVLSGARTYNVRLDLPGNVLGMTMPAVPWWQFDLDGALDFSVNWAEWLADVGADGVAAGVVTAPGMAVIAQGVVGTKLAVVVKALTPGAHLVSFKIVTAEGRVDERTICLEVTQR